MQYRKRRTNISNRNPVCNGFYKVSELNDFLQNGYYENLGYKNVDWFRDELMKLDTKLTLLF